MKGSELQMELMELMEDRTSEAKSKAASSLIPWNAAPIHHPPRLPPCHYPYPESAKTEQWLCSKCTPDLPQGTTKAILLDDPPNHP